MYEYFWTGGASGAWNSTQDGMRALFLTRVEGGRQHVVRDWWRSIFPVTSGYHTRLPLTDAAPLWERIALLNHWFPAEVKSQPGSSYNDPGQALNLWRQAKLWRGMVRHRSMPIRVVGCQELISMGLDECWDELSADDRSHFRDHGWYCCTDAQFAEERRKARASSHRHWQFGGPDERRLLTTISDPKLREEFCRMYATTYPSDPEHGCPATRRPPATIVTEHGEIALP